MYTYTIKLGDKKTYNGRGCYYIIRERTLLRRCRRGNISIGSLARDRSVFLMRSLKRGLINVAAAAPPKLISAPYSRLLLLSFFPSAAFHDFFFFTRYTLRLRVILIYKIYADRVAHNGHCLT